MSSPIWNIDGRHRRTWRDYAQWFAEFVLVCALLGIAMVCGWWLLVEAQGVRAI